MDKICVLPWVSLEATPLGTVRPCCLTHDVIPDIDLTKNTLQEAFDSQYMHDLRHSFLNGEKPETCRRCWDEEAAGRVSKRMNSLTRLRKILNEVEVDFTGTDGKLIFLDLKLGNICNLKCRICGSFSSSKWAQEEIEIQKEWPEKHRNRVPQEHLQKGRWPRQNQDFWLNMELLLPYIRYFEFTGGEPFLIQEHFALLRKAVELGHAGNIEIHYNTNGTGFPQEGLELWPHFKLVEIAFSIDDVGDRFEYQRYGADWKEVNDNIQKFQELKKANANIILQHCLTINVFNIYNLTDLFQWMQQQSFDSTYFNVLHDAWYYSIRSLPDQAKQEIVERYEDNTLYKQEMDNLIRFMLQGDSSDGKRLCKVVVESDNQRKQRLSDHHPDLARAIGYAEA
jgi:MoaA/NifB/PqqE/SkfB family radical SAM enzyme